MSVSGTGEKAGLLRGTVSGPTALTGGSFGPEASVVAVIVCLLVSAFFLWRTLKLKRLEPSAFGKAAQLPEEAAAC